MPSGSPTSPAAGGEAGIFAAPSCVPGPAKAKASSVSPAVSSWTLAGAKASDSFLVTAWCLTSVSVITSSGSLNLRMMSMACNTASLAA